MDTAGAITLAWLVRVAQKPGDDDHPFGHARAEPLGALGIALLAGMLAVQVGSAAIDSLTEDVHVSPHVILLGLFVAKVLFKGTIWRLALGGGRSPAVAALVVDARNDVLVGVIAIVGFFGMRAGYPRIDAWLSLPIAVYIGWSGILLAKENIDLLMDVAPPEERQRALLHLAGQVAGIVAAYDLRAHHVGADISVHVCVSVPAHLTVAQGHDRGEDVKELLLAEEDVCRCTVHVDSA